MVNEKAGQALNGLAWMRCKPKLLGEGTGNVCLSDCVCKGTGLRFYWLSKECHHVLLCHLPGSTCRSCNNRGRLIKDWDELQDSDIARCCSKLGISYLKDGSGDITALIKADRLKQVYESFTDWKSKQAVVLALARAMAVRTCLSAT